ncbi:hypothetical protein DL546_007297 [Coniochaeta pulveracea]|uniref:Uncharacterized protein n=1 Tax=Coniochaeta pulveracea TaxID=177199 RepID=A0A420YBM9_9PEZI|nr:hypothetical protein DL546_007297 [Coniochaeta pulveracea]
MAVIRTTDLAVLLEILSPNTGSNRFYRSTNSTLAFKQEAAGTAVGDDVLLAERWMRVD